MASKKQYKVISIDSYSQTIKEVSVKTLENLQALVGGNIEAAVLSNEVMMYMNEDGRYSHPNIGFHIGHLTICGNAVLVNMSEYDDIPEGTLGMTNSIVKFWDRRTDEEKNQQS